ncbi:MAG: competence protein CoiA family protein [Fusobacteriaceae bacterium]
MLAFEESGEIINIKDAVKNADYKCSDCGSTLRVKDGKVNKKHFFHLNTENCGGTGESLIHKYWKDKISKLDFWNGYEISESRKELRILDGKYIPDIVLKTASNEYIIVEICYKNPKKSEHLKLFKKINWLNKVYEITISEEDAEVSNINCLYDKEKAFESIKTFQKNVKIIEWLSKTKTLIHRGKFFFTETEERTKEVIILEHEFAEDVEIDIWIEKSTYANARGRCCILFKGEYINFRIKNYESKKYLD